MKEEEIRQAVLKLLKDIVPGISPEKLDPDENIMRTLDIDSFDFLQFVIALAKSMKVEIPELDYGKITTLSSLVQYLKEKTEQNK